MSPTNHSDHTRILKFYKLNIPKSKRETKKNAERILGKKLCNCVSAIVKSKRPIVPLNKTRKRTLKEKEKAAVAICRASVLRKKGIMNYGYTCKKKQKLIPGKNGDYLMKYTRKKTIKGGKKKRKYNKKGGINDGDIFSRLTLIQDKQYDWKQKIRGEILTSGQIKNLLNTKKFEKLSGLINNNENIIVSRDKLNYNLYFVDICDGEKYPTENDECDPCEIPINGIVSTDNPFRCRKPSHKRKHDKISSPTGVTDILPPPPPNNR
jgi:hypothetical protein